MGGVAKKVGGVVGDVLTLGTSHIPGSPTKKLSEGIGTVFTGGLNGGLSRLTGGGSPGAPIPQMGMENPAQTLAMTGGAPLLANVAMGVDPKQAIAGYFGASDYNKFYEGLSDSDKQLVDGVTNQLTSIQTNTDLKNKAVQQVVQDFPNIAAEAAKAHAAAGGEFDEVTKGYLDKALGASAAKYAANGNLSSGAMAEASARVGADMGMQKLGYMSDRGDVAYNQGAQGWQARYNEANALRSFQNLMTGQAAGQGFSAVQAMLGRNNATQNNNASMANQNAMADANRESNTQNAMLGAIGGLAGTALGAAFGGPAGAAIGGKVGSGMANYNATPMSPNQLSFASNGAGFSGNPRLNLGY